MTGNAVLFMAVFLACTVEAVEALTIVLAVGVSRGWRSAIQGALAGLLGLALVVAAVGPALSQIPLDALRLVVGGLLLVFGMGWLRKAILRASGYQDLHDEDAIYARQLIASRAAAHSGRFAVHDWYTFTLSFKAVVLEGLEVAFIVITFGSNQSNISLAGLAAATAVVLVVLAGVMVRAPLTRVPENTLKFAVGVLLTSFGTFWAAEGAGIDWPGADAALVAIVTAVVLAAATFTLVLRRIGATGETSPVSPLPAGRVAS